MNEEFNDVPTKPGLGGVRGGNSPAPRSSACWVHMMVSRAVRKVGDCAVKVFMARNWPVGGHPAPCIPVDFTCHHLHDSASDFTYRPVRMSGSTSRFLALIWQRWINRGSHHSTRDLEGSIREYLKIYNDEPRPLVWRRLTGQIITSIAHLTDRINEKARFC